jgi:hypothetical protein
MAITIERGNPFIFVIPVPRVRRVVALAEAAFFLFIAGLLIFKIGLSRLIEVFFGDPVGWLLSAVFVAAIALFLRWAFPPRKVLQRLEFHHDGVSFVPDRMTRRMFAEPAVNAAITPQSREILICRSVPRDVPDGYGYRVIIRDEDGTERGVKAGYLTLHSARDGQTIGAGITAATGLPVRIIGRRRLGDGTVEETPWMVPTAKSRLTVAAALAIGATPYVGGITVGLLVSSPLFIVAFGLALWLSQTIAIFALDLSRNKRTINAFLYLLTNLFLFAAEYGASVVIVAFMFRAH